LAAQNEKRKDKDLTERIEKLLKRREEVTKGVDLGTRQGTSRLPDADVYVANVERAAEKIVRPSFSQFLELNDDISL